MYSSVHCCKAFSPKVVHLYFSSKFLSQIYLTILPKGAKGMTLLVESCNFLISISTLVPGFLLFFRFSRRVNGLMPILLYDFGNVFFILD